MQKNKTKGIKYTGRVMYPPRPSITIPPHFLPRYEKKGFVAQYKFNGTRTLIYLWPDGSIDLRTRHTTPHKAYKLTQTMQDSIEDLPFKGGSWHILDGELMHSKTRGLKDTLILWDALVIDGRYLIGSTYLERYVLLSETLGNPSEYEDKTDNEIALKHNDHIWLAETFMADFQDRWKENIDLDEIEGLLLKKPDGKLSHGSSKNNNGGWQIRCRKPSKHSNY